MQQGSDAAQKLHVEAKECAGACGEAGGGDVKTYFIQALLLRKRRVPAPGTALGKQEQVKAQYKMRC